VGRSLGYYRVNEAYCGSPTGSSDGAANAQVSEYMISSVPLQNRPHPDPEVGMVEEE
jgi:hypothetical protein